MNTKSLFAIAAIITASSAYSPAASYTVPLPAGLTCLANCLDAGAGPTLNRADVVIPFRDGDNIQLWTGASWRLWTMDSASTTGWTDAIGNDAPLNSLPILGPGIGFFYGNNSGLTSITFTGAVRPASPINTPMPIGLSASGSPHAHGNTHAPYWPNPIPPAILYVPVTSSENFDAGLVSSGPVALPLRDGDNIQKWDRFHWILYSMDSLSPTGWTDANGNDAAEPTLFMGEGFFYGNNSVSFTWSQP